MRSSLMLLALVLLVGCTRSSDSSVLTARFDAQSATSDVLHPHFPLVRGQTLEFAEESDSSESEIVTTRQASHFARQVGGVECQVLVERVFVDGQLAQESFEYYAQDARGNVWILGVDATQYAGERPIGREGSWRYDQFGADPGLFLPREFEEGDAFERTVRGELVRSRVDERGLRVDLDHAGSFDHCIRILESQNGERESPSATRLFAAGVGEVLHRTSRGTRQLVRIHDDRRPDLFPGGFTDVVDNPLYPLPPGRTLIYAGPSAGHWEEVVLEVLDEKGTILGIECTTVRKRTWEDGVLLEDTLDWYAQDLVGTVWYLGEEDRVDPSQNWIAGLNGATAGIAMLGRPRVGDSYRTEYSPGIAEDLATVTSLSTTVETPLGTMQAMEVWQYDPVEDDDEPGDDGFEFKYYARHLGLIIEMDEDGDEFVPIIEVIDR